MAISASGEGYQLFIGADISLHSISIAVLSPALIKLEYVEIRQENKEYARLHKILPTHAQPKQALIIMEST